MDYPLASQCRGSKIPLDLMNMMGALLAGIAYGVVVVICSVVLWAGHVPTISWRTFMTFWLLLMATASTALQIKWTLLAFVTQRQNVSPSVFIEENINNWIYVTLNALYVIISWSVDAVLVFRFYLIFDRLLRWAWPPALLYISSLVTGSLALRQLAIPGTTQNTNKLANWLVVYRTVSLSLSVIVTLSIIARLLYFHRRSGSIYRSPRSPFLRIVAMLVESASLDTVSTLVYIIAVGINSPLQNVFLPVLGQVQVIAPMLILYRVAHGRDAVTELTGTNTVLLPKHMTQPTPSIRINTDFSSISSELSASPVKSSRGLFDSPRISYPPPYRSHDFMRGAIPPSPSMDLGYIGEIQKPGHKRTTWS
ncbi:hypothetical protein H4582DRAFT_1919951 [Lactarius indigo]|nr:hypothetical protein H4582DRAFT_1919951 [Lactarius indigo]